MRKFLKNLFKSEKMAAIAHGMNAAHIGMYLL